jgi:hypothetical protein
MKKVALILGLTLAVSSALPVLSRAGTITEGFVATPNGAGGYTFQTVINPGDPNFTQLLGINNSSTIAGYFGDGSVVPNNGFTLVLPSTFTPENATSLGAVQTQVVGINNTGETVGFYIDGTGVNHGFTFNGSTFTDVSNPHTTTVTQLLGVNDSGVAAGYWNDSAGNFHPFTWVSGTFTPISFGGEVSAQATDVNNGGDVTGFNMTSATTSDGFLDIGGVFTTLDFPGSVFTQALGLNNTGDVVGSYVDASGNTHGFLYDISAASYTEINDPFGLNSTVINGINDNGQFVGFFSVTTPEPAALLLMGTGLLALTRKLRKSSV